MKLKIFTLLAIAGFAFAGCGSDKSDDGSLDSDRVDTTMSAPVTDTASLTDSVPDTTTMKPVDSAR